MHAVMLCTSLQNASLLSSALRFWMLSPCVSSWSVCWDLEVTFSFWQNMSLEITHFNTRMHSFIKDDSGLGIFCSSLWNQINENWGTPTTPPISRKNTESAHWFGDLSVKGWEKKQFSSDPWHTSIFIAIRISLCAFSTSRRNNVAFQRSDTMVQQIKQKHHLLVGNTPFQGSCNSYPLANLMYFPNLKSSVREVLQHTWTVCLGSIRFRQYFFENKLPAKL